MQKRTIALLSMILALLCMVVSIEAATGRGVLEGCSTFYQTISPSGKYFYLKLNDNLNILEKFKILIFVIGNLLIFLPQFLLFEQTKIKSISLIFINIIGLVIEFFLFQTYSALLMIFVLCFIIVINIFVQFVNSIKDKTNLLIIVLTSLIFAVNAWYLIAHLSQIYYWQNWEVGEHLISEMMYYSKINISCFSLWFIPYGILLIKELRQPKLENQA